MKKATKVFAVLMVAALAVSGVSAYAVEATEGTAAQGRPAFSRRADAPRSNFGFRVGAMRTPKAGKRAELTEEEKAAKLATMKENWKKALDEKLAAGKITQEQYDERLAKIESGEFGFRSNGRNDAEQPKAWGRNWNKGEKPQRQQLTEEEKAAKLETVKENWKKALDEKLASGKITQEQYDAAIAKLESGEFKFPGNGLRGQRNFNGKPFGGNRQGGNRWQGKGFAKRAEQPAV